MHINSAIKWLEQVTGGLVVSGDKAIDLRVWRYDFPEGIIRVRISPSRGRAVSRVQISVEEDGGESKFRVIFCPLRKKEAKTEAELVCNGGMKTCVEINPNSALARIKQIVLAAS